MKVKCVYRWALDSVISFGSYDTNAGTIDGIDKELFSLPAPAFKYHEGNYNLYGAVNEKDLHRILSEQKNAFVVIDYDCIGVLIIYKQRVTRHLFIGDTRTIDLTRPVFDTHELRNIGLAKTIVEQYSYIVTPQYLYYDCTTEVVHLKDGDYKVNFDIGELEMVTTFNRYVDMIEDDAAVGVVRSGGYNKLLIKDSSTGMLRKE